MGIRQLAAQTLSSRQKSVVRRYLHRVGAYRLREVEQLVDAVVTLDGAGTFLQIGANDGYLSDPLNLAIFRHRLRGTFVEPQAHYFEQLERTYAGFAGLTFLRCAIAEEAGVMRMFSLDCSSGKLPRWAHGVGSLSYDQLLRLRDQIPDVEKHIVTREVPCITVRELLDRAGEADPDIVVVDAEGYDHRILAQFDFAALATKLVIFESESMPVDQQRACASRLEQAGFAVLPAGQDTIAVRRSSATCRKHAGFRRGTAGGARR